MNGLDANRRTRIRCIAGATMMCLAVACSDVPTPSAAPSISDTDGELVTDVHELLDALATDLATVGPVAWTRYFSHDDSFYMVSDGSMVFPSYEVAEAFLLDFGPSVSSLSIDWSDVRVDPIGQNALLATSYSEVIVDTSGSESRFGGYLTAVAVPSDDGWRLQSLHWSSPKRDDAIDAGQ